MSIINSKIPPRTIIYEDQTYPGSTGITIDRQWTVPVGSPDGKYLIRVEYWSFEAGNEANAEVTFYVCSETGNVCAEKWEDTDNDCELSGGDTALPGWWICIETPLGDTYCKQTDGTGEVCWSDLPLGDYTVYENLLPGWIAIYPVSYEFTLTGDPIVPYIFLNKYQETDAEKKSWGAIKSIDK